MAPCEANPKLICFTGNRVCLFLFSDSIFAQSTIKTKVNCLRTHNLASKGVKQQGQQFDGGQASTLSMRNCEQRFSSARPTSQLSLYSKSQLA